MMNAFTRNRSLYKRVQGTWKTCDVLGGPLLNYRLQPHNFQALRGLAGITDKCDSKTVIKGVVVGVYSKEGDGKEVKMTSSGEKFDDRTQGKISELLRETGIKGDLGKGKVFMNVDAEFRAVAVVGLGQEGAGFNDLENIDEGMDR